MHARAARHGGTVGENARDETTTSVDQMSTRAHVGPGDLCAKNECIKYVKDFNKELARYSSLVLALGGATDSESLRDALRKSRRKACDLARQNKHKLLPHLRCLVNKQEEKREYENLWAAYASCLELFEMQMLRTMKLQMFFTFTSGASIFIQTGLQDPFIGSAGHCRGHASASVEHLDDASTDKKMKEKDELKNLERDLHDIRDLLCNMQRLVDVNPWTVEPDIKTEGIKSMPSESECDSAIDIPSSTDSMHRTRRKKCFVFVGAIGISVIVFAVVLAICITYLT